MRSDYINDLFQFDVDFRSHTLFLGSKSSDNDEIESGVDYKFADHAIKGLHLLDKGTNEITVVLNSPGGEVTHGYAVYDAIRGCKNHITIKVYGQCSSMASIILQAGDDRIISPNSEMIIHYGDVVLSGPVHQVVYDAEQLKKDMKITEDIYLEQIKKLHPKYPRKKIKDLLSMDTRLSAKEVLELGLADKILE